MAPHRRFTITRRLAMALAPILFAVVLGACSIPEAERTTLRACNTGTTCGLCMGVRPSGIHCGWCQTAPGAGFCMGVAENGRPATCTGQWVENATAVQCPLIPERAHDPNN